MNERYIDANKIKLQSISAFDDGEELLIPLSEVRKAIQMTPTVDVVSRKVIDEIFSLIWDAFQSTYYDSEFEEKFDKIEQKYNGGTS